MKRWWVYMVRCADGSLYTGASNDVAVRVGKHNAGQGARYTRSRLPVELVWKKRVGEKAKALSVEWHLKRLSRAEKLALISAKREAAARRARRS